MKTLAIFRLILGNSGPRRENTLQRGIPREARAAIAQSETARLRGDACESARHLRRALEIYPNYPVALGLLGIYWSDEGHQDLASQYFRKALDIDPTFVPAQVNHYANAAPGDGRAVADN